MAWFRTRRQKFRLKIRAGALVVGFGAALATSILISEHYYWWASVPAALVLLASVVEFVFGDAVTEQQYPARTAAILESYESRIQNVHNQLLEQLGFAIESLRGCDIQKVNGTLHLVVQLYSPTSNDLEDAFVQITTYSGKLGGSRWRFASVAEGVIGRCFRTREPEWVNFATQEEYDDRMVREFGYTHQDVKRHTGTGRSYWAQPLLIKKEFVGVMFLFSTELQTFPRAVDRAKLESIATAISESLRAAAII